MGLLERGGLLRPTNTWGARTRTDDLRRKCPPVQDCAAQNARPAKPTKKQLREAARIAAAQAASRRKNSRGRKAEPAPQQKQRGVWPFASSYDPKKDRGRG